jgi:hypothetical protein
MYCIRPGKTFDLDAIRAAIRAKLGVAVPDEVLDVAIRETLATVARQNGW